jgi:16S rRNA (cytosine1402-N4)-methyltransferase
LKRVLKSLNIEKVDAVLFDLGISSFQLEGGRGFSFREDSFLDMRMDKDQKLTAYDIVNYYPKDQISRILKEFGEERYHKRIADQIIKARCKEPIRTTKQLVDVILKAVPTSYLRYKIHPATRTFQALRIAVNNELENLEKGLNEAIDVLMPGGRIAVISFHSLEDRIVKLTFKKHKRLGTLDIITPKPLRPTEIEINSNPRSRSAKLRVAQRKVNGNSNLLMKILML